MFEWPIFYFNVAFLVAMFVVGVLCWVGKIPMNKTLMLQSVVAGSIVIAVLLLYQVDVLVHGRLYEFGLQFDLAWASDYWNMMRIAYILLAVAVISNIGSLFMGRNTVLQTLVQEKPVTKKGTKKGVKKYTPKIKRKTKKRRLQLPKPHLTSHTKPSGLMAIAEKLREEA